MLAMIVETENETKCNFLIISLYYGGGDCLIMWQEFRAAIKGHEMNVHLFEGQSIREGEREKASMLNAALNNQLL